MVILSVTLIIPWRGEKDCYKDANDNQADQTPVYPIWQRAESGEPLQKIEDAKDYQSEEIDNGLDK